MTDIPSWEDDLAQRMNPALMTALFHQAVPITAHLGYRIVEFDEAASSAPCLPLAAVE